MKMILAVAALLISGIVIAADVPDPHKHVVKNSPASAVISAAAAKLRFSAKNSIEAAGADAIEYYDVEGGVPKLDPLKPTIIGRVVVKVPGIYLKDSKDKMPVGEYLHWIAKVDGAWIGGFAPRNGDKGATADVRFAVMSDAPHKHLQVYTHSPEGAKAWSDYAQKTALPGTPPTPVPPPNLPKPPETPQKPPEPAPEPPQPPTEWRCVEVWKWVEAPDGTHSCTVTGWVRVPAR
ncbi:MAG: hypothetical protein M0D55_16925 [Elusimicrobiota bacterium]|nr:MAG: hypothetical protein M0D55_16925 [Elusimicrobiota bacterium]